MIIQGTPLEEAPKDNNYIKIMVVGVVYMDLLTLQGIIHNGTILVQGHTIVVEEDLLDNNKIQDIKELSQVLMLEDCNLKERHLVHQAILRMIGIRFISLLWMVI